MDHTKLFYVFLEIKIEMSEAYSFRSPCPLCDAKHQTHLIFLILAYLNSCYEFFTIIKQFQKAGFPLLPIL